MKFPWKVQKKLETPAELKLEQIKNLLFPPLLLEQEIDSDGSVFKFHVDYSLDSNLEAALIDLQEGNNDKTVHDTINEVIKALIGVRKLLGVYAEIDLEAKYIIVENPKNENNIEDIT